MTNLDHKKCLIYVILSKGKHFSMLYIFDILLYFIAWLKSVENWHRGRTHSILVSKCSDRHTDSENTSHVEIYLKPYVPVL